MMRGATFCSVAVIGAVLLLGCRQRCEGLSPRVEVRFALDAGIDRARVVTLGALVSVDGGAARRRDLAASECGVTSGEDRFVIVFDAASPPGRLQLTLLALDGTGRLLGQGQSTSPLDLTANGCNFLTVSLGGAPGLDAGVDGARRDGPRADDRRDPTEAGLSCPGGFCGLAAGSFNMGSAAAPCNANNELEHGVTLTHAFEIGAHEVTQQEFAARLGYNPSASACGDCPVEQVTWHQAAAYCNALSEGSKLTPCYACGGAKQAVDCAATAAFAGSSLYSCPGYRLPTEAEWEYAYRAGTTSDYYFGPLVSCPGPDPNADAIGWYHGNSDGKVHPTCGKKKNAAGLCDMAGNVYEWAHDGYASSLGSEPATDPITPPEGAYYRVLRGGSWSSVAESLRAAHRYLRPPRETDDAIGFRCARSLPPY